MKEIFEIKFFQEIFLWCIALAAAVYLVINIFPAFSAATIVGDGILVYATTTLTALQYRTYASTTNAFSDPAANAQSAINTTVHFVVSDASPTSTEQIVAVVDDGGGSTPEMTVMRWSGTTWVTDWTTTAATSTRRGVDVAYYGNAGSAIIVYATSTASGAMSYRTWNGSSWSGTSTLTLATGATVPIWVETEGFAVATSNQTIVMGYQDKAGAIGAALWNGSAWNAATTTGVSLTTNSNATRQFDVALESLSGDALLAFGYQNMATSPIQFLNCNGANTCALWTQTLMGAGGGGTATTSAIAGFVDLAAAPFNSDSVALAYTCSTNTPVLAGKTFLRPGLGAGIWTGSGWSQVLATLDTTTQCSEAVAGMFPASAAWYKSGTATGTAAIFYSDSQAAALDRATCGANCLSAFSASDVTTAPTCLPANVAIKSVQAKTWSPNANAVMVTTIKGTGGDAGILCNTVTDTSTTGQDPTPSNAEGYVQAPTSGFAAAFSFNRIVSPTLGQRDFRWYVNDANSANPTDPWPTGASDLAENADITQSDSPPATNDIVRLRVSATSTAATIAVGTSFKIQFQATASEDCTSGSWTDVGAATTWALVDNAGVVNGATITRSLTASTVNENYNESNPSLGMPNILSVSSIGEFDWPIKNNGAALGTTYAFRLVQSDGTAFSSYTNCPNIKTTAAPGPNTEQVLRHGTWFNAGAKQSFFWAQ